MQELDREDLEILDELNAEVCVRAADKEHRCVVSDLLNREALVAMKAAEVLFLEKNACPHCGAIEMEPADGHTFVRAIPRANHYSSGRPRSPVVEPTILC